MVAYIDRVLAVDLAQSGVARCKIGYELFQAQAIEPCKRPIALERTVDGAIENRSFDLFERQVEMPKGSRNLGTGLMEVDQEIGQLGDLTGVFRQFIQACDDLRVCELAVAGKDGGKFLLCARQYYGETRELLDLTRGLGSIEALSDDVALDHSELGASCPRTVDGGTDLRCYLEASVFVHGLPSFVAGERGTLHILEKTQH